VPVYFLSKFMLSLQDNSCSLVKVFAHIETYQAQLYLCTIARRLKIANSRHLKLSTTSLIQCPF
jgi:hypothetical protein